MKTFVNIKESKIEDDNLYRAAIARYYLSEAVKKPKKGNLQELAARHSYIAEAARIVKDLIDDETYDYLMKLSHTSFEVAVDNLKDAMDFRSPEFYPDFRVLSSAANSFNKFDGTPWIETLQRVNKERKTKGLFTLCI